MAVSQRLPVKNFLSDSPFVEIRFFHEELAVQKRILFGLIEAAARPRNSHLAAQLRERVEQGEARKLLDYLLSSRVDSDEKLAIWANENVLFTLLISLMDGDIPDAGEVKGKIEHDFQVQFIEYTEYRDASEGVRVYFGIGYSQRCYTQNTQLKAFLAAIVNA